jgi:hypothetical protein
VSIPDEAHVAKKVPQTSLDVLVASLVRRIGVLGQSQSILHDTA